MTYEEFYQSDYKKFENVKNAIVLSIKQSGLSCIQYVTSRIKSPDSVIKKVGKDYAFLHDIIGVRIICSFVDEIYVIFTWIQTQYRILEVRDYLKEPKTSGYRSLHVIISCDSCTVEIQIRTIALDFWANLEHQIHYKKEIAQENLIRKELKRCADEIASLDLSFQTIKDRIEQTYADTDC